MTSRPIAIGIAICALLLAKPVVGEEALAGFNDTPMGTCLVEMIPRLDDYISPANVVAEGIANACISLHPPGQDCESRECLSAMRETLVFRLLPLVLEARVKRPAVAPVEPNVFDQFDPK